MISIKKILVPTDFSKNAEFAFPYAQSLAKAFGAKILVAHVSDVTTYQVGPEGTPITWEGFAGELEKYNENELKKVGETFVDVPVETVELHGAPFVELVRLAREADVDLIVMSTHGRTGIEHLLLGSTAERVVRKAPCPVLTMGPDEA